MGASGTKATPAADPWERWIASVAAGLARASEGSPSTFPVERAADLLEFSSAAGSDLALPVHRLAAESRERPDEVAARLAAAFAPEPPVRSVRAEGAYVNVTIDPEELVATTLDLVFGRGERYGHAAASDEEVCIEHTSANPTGPLHVGRVRNAIVGDTLARAVRAAGAQVTTQYYVDDMGRQAAMLTWLWQQPREAWPASIRASVEGRERPGEKVDHYRGRPYPALSAYLKERPEAAEAVAEFVRTIEGLRAPAVHRQLAEQILDAMVASLARLAIRFDEFVWESDLLRDGSVEKVLERLRSAPHALQEPNGAWAIDAASYGLPKDSTHVVFQRGNGVSLYVTRDVAYHLAKFARFGRVVDVLGQDHHLHARTLDALLAEIEEGRRPSYVFYQDIHAPGGGRMSTRGGSAVWLDDLLDEAFARAREEVLRRRTDLAPEGVDRIAEAVASGAVRFHIVRVAPDKPVRFRWEDALSFEGRSGPFVQYAYARASSVLRKGDAESPPYPFEPARLTDPEGLALVRLLSRWPRTVAYAARTAHVHTLAGYAHELADQFNRFYHAVPVLPSGEARTSRVALVAAVRQTLGNALELLGVVALPTM